MPLPQQASNPPPISTRKRRVATVIVAVLAVVLVGAAIIDLPKSTRAYFGPPTCGFVAMQPADLCRYERSNRSSRSRGRNKHLETLLPSGFVPPESAATSGRVSISDYEQMRDTRRSEIRWNLIAEVIALLVGLVLARSLIRRGIARLRASRG